jgi:hydrogenase-1 operon protein HyaF
VSSLKEIPVAVTYSPDHPLGTGNVIPILNEVRHALQRLASTGDSTAIDLASIPFGPGERDQLLQTLGDGEIQATLHALGETLIRETAYPGAWVVTHMSPQGMELTTHIEVTRTPSLLSTPQRDIEDAAEALAAYLHEQSIQESA